MSSSATSGGVRIRPDSAFKLELAEDVAKGRSLLFKLVLPVLLVLPFALLDMPVEVQTSGLPLIVLFLGVLGSSVGLARMKEGKLIERLSVLPMSRRRFLGEYILANALMDGMQALVPTIIIVAALGIAITAIPFIAISLLLSLLMANSLGVAISISTASSGEVHMFSALSVILVAAMSGLFTGQLPTVLESVSRFLPYAFLQQSQISPLPSDIYLYLIQSLALTLVVLAAALLLSRKLFRAR